MSKKEKEQQKAAEEAQAENQVQQEEQEEQNATQEETAAAEGTDDAQAQIQKLKDELEKEKKEYMFLMADFDNFRKRTLKEKEELLKNGAKDALFDLLPVADDFERAIKAIEDGGDLDSLKEGVGLIYNKFVKYLESKKVKAIESTGKDFDTEYHEAVTMFPAQDDSQRGKVIDTVLKGYTINDKVLRHAKVVVGQ